MLSSPIKPVRYYIIETRRFLPGRQIDCSQKSLYELRKIRFDVPLANMYGMRLNSSGLNHNKFTGKILKVTVDVKPSTLTPADKKAVEAAEEEAEVVQD